MSDLEKLTGRPVWIEWVDSNGTHGWHMPEDCPPGQMECVTLGFLVTEDEGAVQVSLTASATGKVDCLTTIPKVAITRLLEVEWRE